MLLSEAITAVETAQFAAHLILGQVLPVSQLPELRGLLDFGVTALLAVAGLWFYNNALKKVWSWAVGVFKGGPAERALDVAMQLVPWALPIVQKIAAMTPNRTDDELLALFRYYGLPVVEAYLDFPIGKRGMALLDVATALLKRQHPGTPTSVANAAVQIAYTGLRANQQVAEKVGALTPR